MRKILYICLFVCAANAQAESADREKPITIEANRISMDDINKVQIFEGKVVMRQGTTLMRAEKLVVTQDGDGFQKGVATGGPNGLAYFRQKRDNREDYMEGEGERVVHDARGEKTEFFVRAWVRNGEDEVRGAYISFDALTEKYVANSTNGTSKQATGTAQARVRAIIQPKAKTPASTTPDASEALKLQSATPPKPVTQERGKRD